MGLRVLGINHKTSSVDFREKFFLRPLERELFINELKCDPAIAGCFVISTCNRTEIYVDAVDNAQERVFGNLLSLKKVLFEPWVKEAFYFYTDEEAVDHLFRVACSLDSLIMGEKQILGQFKDAVELARSKGMMSRQLNILTNLAIRAGKKAQAETNISVGGASVSWAAVTAAQQRLQSLKDKKILILGAGKMASLAIQQLNLKSVAKVYVMNRNEEKAQELAQQIQGQAVSYWEILEVLRDVDACICSAGAPHYLIETELVRKVMRGRSRPLIMVDISMPRNIHPKVADIEGVELLSLDDLDRVLEDNAALRLAAKSQVEEIIQQKMIQFRQKMTSVSSVLEKMTVTT